MTVRIFTTERTPDGEVAIHDAKQAEIMAEAGKYSRAAIIVENLSGREDITYAQIKWFKGVLLAGLSPTGDSVGYWEDFLKLKVMPDQFARIPITTKNGEFITLPSIKILSKAEMNELIVGSVAHLRDESIYGDLFWWVTLPSKELRGEAKGYERYETKGKKCTL